MSANRTKVVSVPEQKFDFRFTKIRFPIWDLARFYPQDSVSDWTYKTTENKVELHIRPPYPNASARTGEFNVEEAHRLDDGSHQVHIGKRAGSEYVAIQEITDSNTFTVASAKCLVNSIEELDSFRGTENMFTEYSIPDICLQYWGGEEIEEANRREPIVPRPEIRRGEALTEAEIAARYVNGISYYVIPYFEADPDSRRKYRISSKNAIVHISDAFNLWLERVTVPATGRISANRNEIYVWLMFQKLLAHIQTRETMDHEIYTLLYAEDYLIDTRRKILQFKKDLAEYKAVQSNRMKALAASLQVTNRPMSSPLQPNEVRMMDINPYLDAKIQTNRGTRDDGYHEPISSHREMILSVSKLLRRMKPDGRRMDYSQFANFEPMLLAIMEFLASIKPDQEPKRSGLHRRFMEVGGMIGSGPTLILRRAQEDFLRRMAFSEGTDGLTGSPEDYLHPTITQEGHYTDQTEGEKMEKDWYKGRGISNEPVRRDIQLYLQLIPIHSDVWRGVSSRPNRILAYTGRPWSKVWSRICSVLPHTIMLDPTGRALFDDVWLDYELHSSFDRARFKLTHKVYTAADGDFLPTVMQILGDVPSPDS